jgi:NAD(P)-dependent dehydrogenase (short-subunit alcohol dehydrogenase family)
MVNIHVKAPFFLTQKLFIIINKNGSVVNISSGLTRFTFTGYDAYAVIRHPKSFTKSKRTDKAFLDFAFLN